MRILCRDKSYGARQKHDCWYKFSHPEKITCSVRFVDRSTIPRLIVAQTDFLVTVQAVPCPGSIVELNTAAALKAAALHLHLETFIRLRRNIGWRAGRGAPIYGFEPVKWRGNLK